LRFNKRILLKLLFLGLLFTFFTAFSLSDYSIEVDETANNSTSEIYSSEINSQSLFAENPSAIFPPDTNLTLWQLDSLKADSVKLGLIEVDSTTIDSTARIKHFKYSRKDNQFLTLEPERKSSFFAQPSQRILRRTVELDSTGNFVIIKEFIGKNEVKFPLRIPLEQYIEMKLKYTKENSWEQLGYQYTLKQG